MQIPYPPKTDNPLLDVWLEQLVAELSNILATPTELNAVTDPTGRAQGDMLYASAANTLAWLAKGAANLKLFMNAGATVPEWAAGIKIGVTGYDTATATGTQAVTGVGFKPSHLILFAQVASTVEISWGFSNGTSDHCVLNDLSTFFGRDSSYCIFLYQEPGIYTRATISALGADGFTISWTKVGAKVGTATIYYMAFR